MTLITNRYHGGPDHDDWAKQSIMDVANEVIDARVVSCYFAGDDSLVLTCHEDGGLFEITLEPEIVQRARAQLMALHDSLGYQTEQLLKGSNHYVSQPRLPGLPTAADDDGGVHDPKADEGSAEATG